MNENRLSGTIRAALYAAAAMALTAASTQAMAQATAPTDTAPKQAKTLQTVVVTGSHIRRVDLETDNPLITISAQQIQATGKLTLGDVIAQLPAVTGDIMSPNVNNGTTGDGSGSTLVGLRGLGASRTLVLVDGQRVLSKDLNSIPTGAVEQVQVLTSGASAIYGSDAIGGVINFILKNQYQGAQFQANYGISDHNDGERKSVGFTFGQASDKGSILAGVSYQKFDAIQEGARKFSRDVLTFTSTAAGGFKAIPGGNEYSPQGYFSVSPTLAAQLGCSGDSAVTLNTRTYKAGTSPTNLSNYHCFTDADKFNYAPYNQLITPQERTNVFLRGIYHLGANVDAYATYYHDKVASNFSITPTAFSTDFTSGPFISKDSYYNPFGVDFSATSGAVYRATLLAAGHTSGSNSNTTDQLIAGFRGNLEIFGETWQWDAGYNYGHRSMVNIARGLPNTTQLLAGLGPSFLNPAGVVQCGSPDDPISLATCTPWDPFNLNSPSALAAIPAATAPGLKNAWSIERTYHADVNGGIFEAPAGTAQLAVGLSYRKDYTNNTVGAGLLIDPTTLTCVLGSLCSSHLQGGFNVKEVYAELFVPLLKDLPFVHGLNITLGERYSKYSDFGSTSNWKIGVEYRPIADLLLRGTVARVFRAPTISDLFGAPTSSFPFIQQDPCDGITTPGNPACIGVPTDGSFTNIADNGNVQLTALTMGGRTAGLDIGPESGKSFDFGLVYSPHFAPGLSLTADVWRIYLRNTISLVGAQEVLNQCFTGHLEYCPLITRASGGFNAGQINRIVQPVTNLGRFDVKGVDVSAQYQLPFTRWGQFTASASATYMDQFTIQTTPGEAGNEVLNGAGLLGPFGSRLQAACPFAVGGICFLPRVKAQAALHWQSGPWSAQWRATYTSRFRIFDTPKDGPEGLDRYGSHLYHDLMAGYDIEPLNTSIQVGVDNVFDKQPPILFDSRTLNGNTDPEAFDVIGRYYWARMIVSF